MRFTPPAAATNISGSAPAERKIQAVHISELREHQAAVRARIREAVSVAVKQPCASADSDRDGYDLWLVAGGEITLAFDVFPQKVALTRLSCDPPGAGHGTRTVHAIRDACRQAGLVLEIPDPFESSIGFWERFDWSTGGAQDGRVVLRYEPSS